MNFRAWRSIINLDSDEPSEMICCVPTEMLTEQQFALFGRFAFAFNELEFLLPEYLELMLGTPELAVATELVKEQLFWKKVDRFKKVVQAIGTDRPVLRSKTDEATVIANRATTLAKERNKYIHAVLLSADSRTGQARLLLKGNETPFNEAEVKSLIAKTESLVEALSEVCLDLIHLLEEQRKLS